MENKKMFTIGNQFTEGLKKVPDDMNSENDRIYKYNLQRKAERGVSLQAHIADIHFGVMDPKVEYDILCEQFVKVISPLPLDVIAIDGDIFYRLMTGNSDAILYANLLIQQLINKCIKDQTTLIILAGTKQHDAGQLKIFYPYMNNTTLDLRIIEDIRFEYTHGMKILCIPELYGVSEERYRQVLFYSGLYDMCFMHGTIKGAIYGDNVGQGRLFTIDDFCNCMGPIISGHVHTGGCFDKYFYYTGSPVRWSFGEEGEKGFLLVLYDMDTHYHYTYLQPIKSFRYDTIDIDDILNSDPKDVIEYINNLKAQGIDYIRLKYTDYGDVESRMKVVKDYYKTDQTIKFKSEKLKTLEKQKMSDETEALYDQYSYIFSKSLSPYDILARYINDNSTDIIVSAQQIEDLIKEI